MTGLVFGVVLASAIVHASWNAIAKSIPDQRIAAGLMATAGMLAGAAGAAVLPVPDRESWPFLVTSSVLQAVYLLLLVHAYRYGEFGRVYPLARGMPPVLVTVVSIGVLGEQISAGQLGGVVIVSFALTMLVFWAVPSPPTTPAGNGRPRTGSGLGLAAATGLVITAYTLVDGVGVRQSGHAISYAMWLFLLQGVLLVVIARGMHGPGFAAAMRQSARFGLLAGLLGLASYAAVLWAQNQAPLPLVSAVRETSVLFAGVIGTLVFGERFSLARLTATVAVVAGLVLIRVT